MAAACAEGTTVIRDAGELRHKESDRIQAMAEGLSALGVDVEELQDGLKITGGNLHGGMVESYGDHRIAMAMGIAGLKATEQVTIRNADCTSVSFPGFWGALSELAYGESSAEKS